MPDKFEIQNQYQHFGIEKKNSIHFDIVVIIQMFCCYSFSQQYKV